jgi:hypothetical protein
MGQMDGSIGRHYGSMPVVMILDPIWIGVSVSNDGSRTLSAMVLLLQICVTARTSSPRARVRVRYRSGTGYRCGLVRVPVSVTGPVLSLYPSLVPVPKPITNPGRYRQRYRYRTRVRPQGCARSAAKSFRRHGDLSVTARRAVALPPSGGAVRRRMMDNGLPLAQEEPEPKRRRMIWNC